jgi:hypothetical protein
MTFEQGGKMHGKAEVVGVEFVELSKERQIQIMRRTAEAWVKRRGMSGGGSSL